VERARPGYRQRKERREGAEGSTPARGSGKNGIRVNGCCSFDEHIERRSLASLGLSASGNYRDPCNPS